MPIKYAHKIADSLSLALNPFLLLPIIFLIALFVTPFPTPTSQSRWLAVILLGNFIIPFWWVYYLDQHGIVLDDTLAHKKLHRKRLIALWPVMVIIAGEVLLMLIWSIHQPLFAVLVSAIFIALIAGGISYFWKISAHMAGISSTIAYLTILSGPWALWGSLVIPFLIWARLALHRHTPTQLFMGVVVPPIIILATFYWFRLI